MHRSLGLRATYESGSELIEKAFKELDNEVSRSAINIEPVLANTNDIFQILRCKLFKKLPSEAEYREIALEYKNAIHKARQMGITGISADSLYADTIESYPFHPCLRDLFARFKENRNFMQTRGIIRLIRSIIRQLYEGPKLAGSIYLIGAHNYDLNQQDMFAMIRDIKPKLVNAIPHDIASNGSSVAEDMDNGTHTHDASDAGKLILMASLGDVPGVLLGLSDSEIIGYLAAPGRDVSDMKKTLVELRSRAWYLYTDKDGRYFFKDIQNINAALVSMTSSYTIENAKQEIKRILEERFAPKVKDCYQAVYVFPAIDEILLSAEKTALILFEPNITGGGLHPELVTFYEAQTYKNRVMYLSGQRNTMDNLLEAAKENRGIRTILSRLKNEEKLSESEPLYQQALSIQDRVLGSLYSAIRETFVTLFYPTASGIKSHQIEMNFSANNFDPEEQIRKLLIETVKKFDVDTTMDTWRRKIEARIFTTRQMLWRDVLQRAAMNPAWSWHHPSALTDAKNRYIANGQWAEEGDIVDKEPPIPATAVSVRELFRNNDQKTVTLRIIMQNGNKVHWEIGQDATEVSAVISRPDEFITDELELSFICIDDAGKHAIGVPYRWVNTVSIRYRFYDFNGAKYCELEADNKRVTIKYSTDGSNPKTGATYDGPFAIPAGAKLLQALAFSDRYSIIAPLLSVQIPAAGIDENVLHVDKRKGLTLVKKLEFQNTADVLIALTTLQQRHAELADFQLNIQDTSVGDRWLDFSCGKEFSTCLPEKIMKLIETFRTVFMAGSSINVTMSVRRSRFEHGEDFLTWVADRKEEVSIYRENIIQ